MLNRLYANIKNVVGNTKENEQTLYNYMSLPADIHIFILNLFLHDLNLVDTRSYVNLAYTCQHLLKLAEHHLKLEYNLNMAIYYAVTLDQNKFIAFAACENKRWSSPPKDKQLLELSKQVAEEEKIEKPSFFENRSYFIVKASEQDAISDQNEACFKKNQYGIESYDLEKPAVYKVYCSKKVYDYYSKNQHKENGSTSALVISSTFFFLRANTVVPQSQPMFLGDANPWFAYQSKFFFSPKNSLVKKAIEAARNDKAAQIKMTS